VGIFVRKPVIMAVDDEVGVLHAVERDLSSHYSEQFRILVRDLHGSHTALTCLNAAEAALLASSVPVVGLLVAAMTRKQGT